MSKRITTNTTAARIERWRGHVAKRLTSCNANGVDIPAGWLEEIERRPMVDVVMDWLCKDRGIGVTNRNPDQQYNFQLDEDYERAATRTRNNHEREVALMAVMAHVGVAFYNVMPCDETMHALVRKFYHAGDCGIDAAIARAVVFAVSKAK